MFRLFLIGVYETGPIQEGVHSTVREQGIKSFGVEGVSCAGFRALNPKPQALKIEH